MAQISPELAHKSVLVLEDNPIISKGICLQFELLGFTKISAVQTLTEAANLINDQLPDIALLDINLGRGETSFEFARTLFERGVTILFSTGFVDRSGLPEEMRDLVFLTKPFFAEELSDALAGTQT